jgi:hypothetical protein
VKRSKLFWLTISLVFVALFIGTEVYLMISMGDDTTLSSAETGWDGSSVLREELEDRDYDVVSLLSSPSLLHEEIDPEGTIFLSLGAQRAYTLSEIHAIRKFINKGGRFIMADDTGLNNRLSARDDVTIIKGQLYDQNFVGNPDIVKVNVGSEFYEGSILMNRPASLTFTSGRALMASTTSAWVDRNGNGINDNVTTNQGEAQGIRYLSVISRPDFLDEDTGTTIYISDPSMFMNGMIELEDNLLFSVSMMEFLLPDGGKIIFDDSVHNSPGGERALQRGIQGLVFLTSDVNLKIIVGSVSVLSLLAVGYLYESPSRPKHDPILKRTGVAELIEPDLLESDLDELKKVVLEKVRVSNSISVEDFSQLSWEQLGELLGDQELLRFIRKGKYRAGTEKLLIEVIEWQKK